MQMTTNAHTAPGYVQEYPTFGLPTGSVRGLLSVLICSFFWIVLLLPPESTITPPLGHFFLLTLVFLAFASHPAPDTPTHVLPWLLRILFVGGTVAVVVFALVKDPHLAATRLTPSRDEIAQWPVLLGCLAGGFATGLILRSILGRRSEMFMTLRAWVGVVSMLLLLAETILQFLILPNVAEKNPEALKIWEGILIAPVAGYFGSRM
jgi:hypothetical protein